MRRFRLAVGVVLVAATLAVYAPVRRHGFVNFDDPEYVTDNPMVTAGFTRASVAWAFTRAHSANWHPLTWLSHMTDCALGGLDAGVHHVSSVALHAAASVALFLVLTAMTGAGWPSAWVAALFALHPLHVESVAWVSERKDVLSGLFWMLTLAAWLGWVRRPGPLRYAAVVAAFACGLMAKPMVVTLPFVLLLLDLWPLGRLGRVTPARLVAEKLPLFALAAAASAVTFVVQRQAGAVATLAGLPLGLRVENALVAYARYLALTVWPAGLAPFYPLRALAAWEVAGAATLLVALTVAALALRRRRPYVTVGWLWWLGTLVPVIGLVKAGDQAMADRFTYLPHVGLFIAVAWGAGDLARRSATAPGIVALVAVTTLAGAAAVTAHVLPSWRDSETLWRRTLAVTRDNHLAHTNLAAALETSGRSAEARPHWEEALRLKPDSARALANLGMALAARGERAAAAARYAEALRADPAHPLAHYNVGVLLAEDGRLDEAIEHYRAALTADPSYARAASNLGLALAAQGRLDEAVDAYRAALRLRPALAVAHNNLAVALERLGRADEAVAHYAEAVRLEPTDVRARFNLGATLAAAGRADEAVAAFRDLTAVAPDMAEGHYGLASTLAGAGRTDEARAPAARALELARHGGREPLAREIETHLAPVLDGRGTR